MSLVYDFNIAMKAYGEEKVNPYFNIIHSRYINLSIRSINKNTCTQIHCSALLTYFNHRHVNREYDNYEKVRHETQFKNRLQLGDILAQFKTVFTNVLVHIKIKITW
jgi:hypothetical protein